MAIVLRIAYQRRYNRTHGQRMQMRVRDGLMKHAVFEPDELAIANAQEIRHHGADSGELIIQIDGRRAVARVVLPWNDQSMASNQRSVIGYDQKPICCAQNGSQIR